ncbi:MAG: hypothetical protein WC254_02340 [Candidatus Woesearchaeota archaeon]|jgi:hypothetical protein
MANKSTKKAKKPITKPEHTFRSSEELMKAEKELGNATSSLPLPQSFFVTSILGLIISATLMIYGRINETWGFAFCMVFVMMFIASFVSITPSGKDI